MYLTEGAIIMKEYLGYYSKSIITVLLVVLTFGIVGYFAYHYISTKDDKLHEAVALTQEQSMDAAILKNKLEISEQNAIELQKQIQKAQAGITKPVVSFTQTAGTIEEATIQVQERINNKDPALPSAALEKTDRTIVAPQPDNKDFKVGVYKINLAKRNAIGLGLESHKSDFYSTISYEHVYKKDKAVEAELHYDIADKKVNGGGVEHKWYF